MLMTERYLSVIPTSDQHMVDEMMVTLPKWIEFDLEKRIFKVTLKPVICQKCGTEWYPRIKSSGQIIMPRACAKKGCRNKLWWRSRN